MSRSRTRPRFLKELRRRRVFRVAGIYIVAAWVAVQVFSEAFPALDVPAEAIRFVWIGAVLGFPLALLFGWFYDITPEGIVRTPPSGPDLDADPGLRRIDYAILAALSVVAVGIVYQLSVEIRGADTAPRPTTDPMSIAVLPLENLSGDPEQAYFVNGMHDALITELSRISGLRVTSRTSTLAYAETRSRIPDIAKELGVEKIIEGSVYRVDDRVRIVVQLIEAADDRHLWTETYERELTDVMRLQSDITGAIADAVQVTLTADESRSLAAAGTVDTASYEAYLRGNFHLEKYTPEDMQLAYQHFHRAAELDSENAFAHWGLSRLCRFQLQAGLLRPRDGEPQCRAALMRALDLDSSLAEVHFGLAAGYWLYDYNWPAAEAEFGRALEINPNYAEARMFYSHFLANLGRADESSEQMRMARELDPLNTFTQGLHGVQLAMTGSVDEGIAEIHASLEAAPGLAFGYDVLWIVYARLGRLEESLDAARKHFGVTMGNQAAVDAMQRGVEEGGYEGAMLAAAELLADLTETMYVPAIEISGLYGQGGDLDNAIEWLQIAYDQHSPSMPYIGALPLFAISEPGYQDMLRRMNLDHFVED